MVYLPVPRICVDYPAIAGRGSSWCCKAAHISSQRSLYHLKSSLCSVARQLQLYFGNCFSPRLLFLVGPFIEAAPRLICLEAPGNTRSALIHWQTLSVEVRPLHARASRLLGRRTEGVSGSAWKFEQTSSRERMLGTQNLGMMIIAVDSVERYIRIVRSVES